MRAIGYFGPGLPITHEDALRDLDVPEPPAPTGRDLLVRVHAVSVNPRDVKSRRVFEGTPDRPVILGYDASGIVEAVGPEAVLFQPGDPVFYAGVLNRPGSNAELQLVDERIVGRKPTSLDHATSASLPLTALTAYEMLFDRLGVPRGQAVGAGDAILILGGAGGVPSIAIQLARGLTGLTVVATASRPESERWVRALGAQHVVNHLKPLKDGIEALELQKALRYVFSTHTDAQSWADIAGVIAPQGRFGLIDDPEPLDLRLMKMKSVSIHWEAMFTRPMFGTGDMVRQHEILTEVAGLVDAGVLKATATLNVGIINAANLRQAHATIEAGRTVGKLVLAGF
ncbi:MAG: zinc-binding alcohol dehydrogenase family protein [Janthinobacterium lividum]